MFMIQQMPSFEKCQISPKPQVFSNEIKFEESRLKVSFWVKNLNDKDKYKLIVNRWRKVYHKNTNQRKRK